MKLALLVPAAVGVAIAISGSAAASTTDAAGGTLPCAPKVVKIQGKTALEACGPATATVTVSGKTYSFKSGLCESSAKGTLLLQLGTLVTGSKGNAGYPAFDITVNGSNAILTGDYKGKDIIPVSDFLVTAKTTGTYTGTFSSGRSTPKMTGAWNCHSVIFKTPG
jgi:hypothetical protein